MDDLAYIQSCIYQFKIIDLLLDKDKIMPKVANVLLAKSNVFVFLSMTRYQDFFFFALVLSAKVLLR